MVGDMSNYSEFEREILEAMKEVGYSELESLRDSPGESDGLKRAAVAELARRAPRIPGGSQLDLETIAGQRMRAGTIEDDLVEAWKELRRLGHGTEVIFCFGKDGEPLCTSHVGDGCWDTVENRRKTFNYIARKEREAKGAFKGGGGADVVTKTIGNGGDGVVTITSARCNHVDGGPMGSDLQCVLMAGHVGGCRYL
jgi:hypothetical protein